jgi:hypothetical protein
MAAHVTNTKTTFSECFSVSLSRFVNYVGMLRDGPKVNILVIEILSIVEKRYEIMSRDLP